MNEKKEHKNWSDCLRISIKPVIPNPNLIRSLLASSENTAYSASILPLNERTAATKVADTYDALRELLEAIALQNGYKIYNHECYTAFLKEILKKLSEGQDFDRFRILRHNLKYYGKTLSLSEAADIIRQIEHVRETLRPLIKENP